MDLSSETALFPVVVPLSWIISGCVKRISKMFLRHKSQSVNGGLGGFPSTHNAVTSSIVFAVLFTKGPYSVEFMIASGLFAIVCMDSLDLRNHLGQHAKVLNELALQQKMAFRVRERLGHKIFEVLGGIAVGFVTCLSVMFVVSFLLST